jgi:predicted nucleotidyltransferase
MRLKEEIKNKIVEYSKKYFLNSKVYLFGSRVYDDKKGGDIDLFIESDENIDIKIQMQFLKEIYKNVTQRKIDLVIKQPLSKEQSIFNTAKKEGIRLC